MFDRPYTHTPWFIDIFVDNRALLQEFLKAKGIGSRLIYPELSNQKINNGWFHSKHRKQSEIFALA